MGFFFGVFFYWCSICQYIVQHPVLILSSVPTPPVFNKGVESETIDGFSFFKAISDFPKGGRA